MGTQSLYKRLQASKCVNERVRKAWVHSCDNSILSSTCCQTNLYLFKIGLGIDNIDTGFRSSPGQSNSFDLGNGDEENSTILVWTQALLAACSMSLSTLLIIVVVLLLLLSVLYIPLPLEICDRKKVYLVELGLRIANEHIVSVLPDSLAKGEEKYLGEPCRISSRRTSEEQTDTLLSKHFIISHKKIER